jgi:uncharacterized protein YktA (UPF0223 family)
VIAGMLVIVAFLVTIYGMYLKWTTTDILAILAFFGPLLTAVITYYFGQKSEEKRLGKYNSVTVALTHLI